MNRQIMKDKLLEFFQNNILYDESIDDIDWNESLIDKGYIDSIGIITLVSFIGKNLEIDVYDSEIIPENFDSINNIYSFLSKKLNETELRSLGGAS